MDVEQPSKKGVIAMQPEQSPAKTLQVTRIIWFALLAGQMAFALVVLSIAKNQPEHPKSMTQLLWYIALAMAAVAIPLAYLVRKIVYRNGMRDGVVAPSAYATGSIIFWAMCEGVALFAMVGALLARAQGPHLFVAILMFAVQVLNYPTGKQMSDQPL
jgi:F0F1-type ATP synthase membrane subunit c/vacuolar-type H+-ATPase subunit K